ncbi:MAG TPA: cell division protein CrgA [Acidimicrobiales bacterium]|nr:cell division protein CrgA [Acidimicrobiales bacterium]
MSPLSKQGPGRATRKGRPAGRTTTRGGSRPKTTSGRYTPPIPRSVKRSPKWMGPLILAFLVVGTLTIVLNYFNVLPDSPTNWYLLGGIVLIAGGFVIATQYR